LGSDEAGISDLQLFLASQVEIFYIFLFLADVAEWQTRSAQDAVTFGWWRFKSSHPHLKHEKHEEHEDL
jgi:hypothetical protein